MTEEQDIVPVVGGPKDGENVRWSTCQFYTFPDSKDRTAVALDDGSIGYLFGEHTYEMKRYAKGDERKYQLEYVGYKKPGTALRMVRSSNE